MWLAGWMAVKEMERGLVFWMEGRSSWCALLTRFLVCCMRENKKKEKKKGGGRKTTTEWDNRTDLEGKGKGPVHVHAMPINTFSSPSSSIASGC